jgi:DNA-binding MurR/RpiR family transcriptional regulator
MSIKNGVFRVFYKPLSFLNLKLNKFSVKLNMEQNIHIQNEPPETFETLRERIRDRFEALSPHLQRIARLALDQPNQFALQTIAVISKNLDVQPSTLIRFAKDFSYDGFSGMQQVFKLRLIEGGPVHREQVYEETASANRGGDSGAILNECVASMISSLEQLLKDVRPEDLTQSVDLCLSARHIYVAGLRRARPIARYFAYGMTRLERKCSMLDFGGGMAGQQVANMGHQDLLVAVAFTPYSSSVVDVVRDAHFRGLPIIVITDTPSSPLARNSTISFYADAEGTGQFRPISGAIGIVQSMIVALSSKL